MYSYQVGYRIVGDLDILGWVVVRWIRLDQDTDNNIDVIVNNGGKTVDSGTWHSFETQVTHQQLHTSIQQSDCIKSGKSFV